MFTPIQNSLVYLYQHSEEVRFITSKKISMKNIFKTVFLAALAFSLFVATPVAHAAVTFQNTVHPTTGNPSYNSFSPNNWTDVVAGLNGSTYTTSCANNQTAPYNAYYNNFSAAAGETVCIRVYFHNTGNTDASNVPVAVTVSPNGQTFNISASYSSGGSSQSGSANVTVSNNGVNQTLNFIQGKYYRNTGNGTSLNTATFTSLSGINIPFIPGGTVSGNCGGGLTQLVCGQGSLELKFQVSNNQPQACTTTLWASDYNVDNTNNPQYTTSVGYTATSGCTTATLVCNGNTIASQPGSNYQLYVAPGTSTQCQVNATGNGSVNNAPAITIYSAQAQTPNCTLSITPSTTVAYGGSASVTYTAASNGCQSAQMVCTGMPTYYGYTQTANFSNLTSTVTCTATAVALSGGTSPAAQTSTITVNGQPQGCVAAISPAGPLTVTNATNYQQTLTFGNGSGCNNTSLTLSCTNGQATNPYIGGGTLNVNLSSAPNGGQVTCTVTGATNQPSVTITKSAPTVCSLVSISPTQNVTYGSGATVNYQVSSGCTSATLSCPTGQSASTVPSGSVFVPNITANTTCTLNASGANNQFTDYANITVGQATACTITISPNQTVTSGTSATVTYSMSNNCVNPQMSCSNGQTVYGLSNTATLSNVMSPVTCTATGTSQSGVGAQAQSTVSVSTVPPPASCVINYFNQNQTVGYGSTATLSYSISSGCDYAELVSPTGTQTINPGNFNTSTTTGVLYSNANYTLKAYKNSWGWGGTLMDTKYVAITVLPQSQNCTITSLSPSTSVAYGGSASVSYATAGCTNATLTCTNGSQTYGLSNSLSVGPLSSTTTCTVNATGTGAAPSQSMTISVSSAPSYCTISAYANPTNVTTGSASTLYWSSSNCTSVTISGGSIYGTYGTSGSLSTGTLLASSTQYAFTGNGGTGGTSSTVYATVTTSAAQPTVTQCNNGYDDDGDGKVDLVDPGCTSIYDNSEYNTVPGLYVTTSSASSITPASARLNGYAGNMNNNSTTGYFEWGTSASNLAFTTLSQNLGSGNSAPFFDTITGLEANTYYYFRAVATNSTGTSKGDIKFFRTLRPIVTPAPGGGTVVQTVYRDVVIERGVGTGSNLIELTINNQDTFSADVNSGMSSPTACVGDAVNYTVTYKNTSGRALKNVALKIELPKDVSFESTSAGIYNKSDHTILLTIGTLEKDQQGTMLVSVKVLRTAKDSDFITTSATIGFLNETTNAQGSATVYATNSTLNCANNLAGLALFGDGFWPTTLIGWLLLILLVLGLIWLIRWIYLATPRRQATRYVAPQGPIPTPRDY